MSSDPPLDQEFMYGWLICRFDRKQIHSILYGQFSKQPLPPSNGWVFLAKNGADESKDSDIVKLSREGLEGVYSVLLCQSACFIHDFTLFIFAGDALSLFAKGLDLDEVIACSNSVTGSGNDGISVSPDFLQNDKDPGAAPTRYYVLRNCPIPAVNGRYMDGGFHEGAPVYRNVREWALGTFWIDFVLFAEAFTDSCHDILLFYLQCEPRWRKYPSWASMPKEVMPFKRGLR